MPAAVEPGIDPAAQVRREVDAGAAVLGPLMLCTPLSGKAVDMLDQDIDCVADALLGPLCHDLVDHAADGVDA